MSVSASTSKTSKLINFGATALVAATLLATSFSTDAYAGKRERWIAGGVAAGIVTGAIIANSRNRDYDDDREVSRWERHVDRCYRAYRSYDEETDTYIDRRGRERRCRK